MSTTIRHTHVFDHGALNIYFYPRIQYSNHILDMVPHPIKFVKMLKQNTLCLEVAGALRTLTALAAELPSDFSGSADCHLKQVVEKKKKTDPTIENLCRS